MEHPSGMLLKRAGALGAFALTVATGCAPGDAEPPAVTFVQSQGYVPQQPLQGVPGPAAGALPGVAGAAGVAGIAGGAEPPQAGTMVTEPPPAAGTEVSPPVSPPGSGGEAPPPTMDPPVGTAVDAGVGEPPPTAMPDAGPPAVKPTKLSVTVTTNPLGGKWGPVNVGAIWVEDSAGKWVHTMEYWTGFLNVGHLAQYVPMVSQGAPTPGLFNFPAPVDTVGRATLDFHETHSLSWGLKDANGAEIPDGMYKLRIEVTEEEGPGETLDIPFAKGPAAMSITPPQSPYFTDMSIALE